MRPSADIVIIGAGVIGASTAYHLARLGVTHTVVVEMGQPGSGSSSKSASMLSLQFSSDELGARLAQMAYARYMQFEQEIGAPIDFHRTGWLSMALHAAAENLLAGTAMLRSLGVICEELSPAEIAYRYPLINTNDLAVGVFGPDDGPFDPHMILWGYLRRARELGARLLAGVRATGIAVQGGRVTGVHTDQGFIAAGTVINAAGPWAAEVAGWGGVGIILAPVAGQLLAEVVSQGRASTFDVAPLGVARFAGGAIR
jgi:glycine/D-amino acid oxidase-like deaminating enzyme